jgi:hypothetical protein
MPIGTVAARAHQSGNAKSAIIPKTEKTSQKTFRCIELFHRNGFREVAGLIHVAAAADGDVVGQ